MQRERERERESYNQKIQISDKIKSNVLRYPLDLLSSFPFSFFVSTLKSNNLTQYLYTIPGLLTGNFCLISGGLTEFHFWPQVCISLHYLFSSLFLLQAICSFCFCCFDFFWSNVMSFDVE